MTTEKYITDSRHDILLETERLYITVPAETDFENLCILQTDPQVMKFFGGIRSHELIHQRMLFFIEHYKKHGVGYGLVYLKHNNQFVGRAGLNKLRFDDKENRVELGIMIMPEFWNCGYASELCTALIKYGQDSLRLKEIYFAIDRDNGASIKAANKQMVESIGTIDYLGEEKLLFVKKLLNK